LFPVCKAADSLKFLLLRLEDAVVVSEKSCAGDCNHAELL